MFLARPYCMMACNALVFCFLFLKNGAVNDEKWRLQLAVSNGGCMETQIAVQKPNNTLTTSLKKSE